MRRRRTTTWLEFAAQFSVRTCTSADGCRRRWSRYAHKHGRIDHKGIIHWDGLPRRGTAKGAYHFLVLVALAKHPEWTKLPEWDRIYRVGSWANWYGSMMVRIRVPFEATEPDRRKVRDLGAQAFGSHRAFMRAAPNAYAWGWYRPRSLRGKMKPAS